MKRQVIPFLLIAMLLLNGCKNEKRTIISLNGEWKIEEGSKENIPGKFTHTIKVPGLVSLAQPAFTNAGPKVKDRRSLIQVDSLREAFWYYRTFSVNGEIPEIALLKVSKAMFGIKVFLNGKDLGEHLPCFTPGYFNVREALKKGENEIIIRVGSARNSVPFSVPDGFDFEKDRYIPGIFDNVELIMSGTPLIISVQAAPDIERKQVRIQVRMDNPAAIFESGVDFLIAESATGKVAGKLNKKMTFLQDRNILSVTIPIKDCRLWSPEDPFLYDLKVTTAGDEYSTRFGMREFRYDTVSGKPMLNGKPYFLRGTNATLYRFFEDDACKDLPWDSAWVRALHKSFRQFHWNSIRYCIGIAPEEWYRIADEEGILIQDEFPIWYGGKGWNVWPEELNSKEMTREYTEWMQDQWNHPSIIIWDASNETVSHNGKTEEIADAIKNVRALDISHRPWDNSYSNVREPGDVVELHPYHFQNPKFTLKDLAKADVNPGGGLADSVYMKIINEYGWLWLNRDGTPTTLTKELYTNLLGENSTEAERRHLYATYLAAETEFWRCHRRAAGVLHFTALGYSRTDGQTSDHFLDVGKLKYENEFLKYLPDAFSPVGLMLDEWGNEIKAGSDHNFHVTAINDLEPEWKGKITLRIIDGDKTVAERSEDVTIPSFGQSSININLITPEKSGKYIVTASLLKENEKEIVSYREISFN